MWQKVEIVSFLHRNYRQIVLQRMFIDAITQNCYTRFHFNGLCNGNMTLKGHRHLPLNRGFLYQESNSHRTIQVKC